MMIDKKLRVLFIDPSSGNTFIKNDERILKKHFNIRVLNWPAEKHTEFKILKILLRKDIDLIFMWFARRYFAPVIFFSKLFRIPSIVIAGGGDVATVPEINYGQFTLSWHKRMLSKYVLKNADMVLPVSNFTKNEMLEKVKPKKLKLVYNGVDIKKFKPSGEKENNLVITVGGVKWSNLKRKGIEPFVKTAKFLPEARFVVIGKYQDDSIDYLKSIAPSNVEFTGFVSEDELIKWYQKAKVYNQPSRHEGFGCSVAEAMLCECIPVVSTCGALPEVIGDCGFTVPYGDEKATAEAIKKALNAPDEFGKKARNSIKENFPLKRREKELVKIINNMIECGE